MKRLVLIICVGVLAIAQTPVKHGEFVVEALHNEVNGHVRHLSGSVLIETDAMTLRADEADINEETAEILPRGDVRIKLK